MQSIACHVDVDPILSEKTQQEIIAFIESSKHTITKKDEFKELLVARFPSIKTLCMHKDASGIVRINLESSRPLIAINHEWVLTDVQSIIPKTLFMHHAVSQLANLQIPHFLPLTSTLSDEWCQLITHLPAYLFDAYNLAWIDETQLWLYDKQHEYFALLAHAAALPDAATIARCNHIKKDLESKGLMAKVVKKKSLYVADVRFKNQIILRSYGGNKYG